MCDPQSCHVDVVTVKARMVTTERMLRQCVSLRLLGGCIGERERVCVESEWRVLRQVRCVGGCLAARASKLPLHAHLTLTYNTIQCNAVVYHVMALCCGVVTALSARLLIRRPLIPFTIR